MHAASRSALDTAIECLTGLLAEDDSVAAANEMGTEVLDAVEILDSDRPLRVAVADRSVAGEQRAALMRDVFAGKARTDTVTLLAEVAASEWSTPREMRDGLVELGRRALLKAAERQGILEQVERELFQLSVILQRETTLTQLLSDRTTTGAAKRHLLASVLYGKVSATTEALALQAIGRPTRGPIEDLTDLSVLAAATRGKSIATVTSAVELTDAQRASLTQKLNRIYGCDVTIHAEVDPSLLGGMIIHFGSEVIDGSTRGKLERLRSTMA